MALVRCSECGRSISSKASCCPQCGNPIAVGPTPLPQSASPAPANPSPNNRKPIGGIIAALGGILIVLAVVRLNSVESQLIRGFGDSDTQAITMLVIGIPAVLIGIWIFNTRSHMSTQSNGGSEWRRVSTEMARHGSAVAIHCAAWFVLFLSMYWVVPQLKRYFMDHRVDLSSSAILVLKTSDWICNYPHFTLLFLLVLLTLDAFVPILLTQPPPGPVRQKVLFYRDIVMLGVPLAILVPSQLVLWLLVRFCDTVPPLSLGVTE